MKDNDVTIIAIVSLALALGFFAFLAYLRKEEPITTIQTAQAKVAQTPQTVYVPQENKIVATEEIRPTRPHLINHYLRNANQWYEIRLPTDAVVWQLKARGNYDILYSFEPSHSTYITLVRGSVLNENTAPNMSIRSIYVMCETAEVTVELEVWRNHG